MTPTPNPPALLPVVESDREFAYSLFADPDMRDGRLDWCDTLQKIAAYRLQSTPAEPKVSREAELREAIRKAKRAADEKYGIAWLHLEEISRFELVLAELSNPPADRDDLAWFSERPTLSLDHYSPVYGDDDDQSVEWRVSKVSGPVNDREWDIVGRGETAAEAIKGARAFFRNLAPPSAPLGAAGQIGEQPC